MRNYALTLAQPSLTAALIPRLVQCGKSILLRRNIRKALSSNGANPVNGLADSDLRRLLTLPMSCNLAMEIERMQFLSSRKK